MVNKKLINEWIEKAEEDFGFASSIIEESAYYAQICFHFQQAAEKYLKTYIVAYELEFRKSHELVELLGICKAKDQTFASIEEECNYLNRFYIDTRYPVHWPVSYSKEDALKAKIAVKKIADTVFSLISEIIN